MCVWHAAEASDKTGRATTTSIRNITESFSQFAAFDFSRKHYKSLFQCDTVDLYEYKRYVLDELKTKSTETARQIEEICWKVYDTATGKRYTRLTRDDTGRLWFVFNRLATIGSHPLSTTPTHANWLCENLADNMGVAVQGEVMSSSCVTFDDLLAYLNKTIFVGVTTESIHDAVFVAYRYNSLVSFIGSSRHSSYAKSYPRGNKMLIIETT